MMLKVRGNERIWHGSTVQQHQDVWLVRPIRVWNTASRIRLYSRTQQVVGVAFVSGESPRKLVSQLLYLGVLA